MTNTLHRKPSVRLLVVLTALAVIAAQGQLVAFAQQGPPPHASGQDQENDRGNGQEQGQGSGNAGGNGQGNGSGQGNNGQANGSPPEHANAGGGGQGNPPGPSDTEGLPATEGPGGNGPSRPSNAPVTPPGLEKSNPGETPAGIPASPAAPGTDRQNRGAPVRGVPSVPDFAALGRVIPLTIENLPVPSPGPTPEVLSEAIQTPSIVRDTAETVLAALAERPMPPMPIIETETPRIDRVAAGIAASPVDSGPVFDPVVFSGFRESLFGPSAAVPTGLASAPAAIAGILEETRSYAGFTPARFSGLDDAILAVLAGGNPPGPSNTLPQAAEESGGQPDDAATPEARLAELAGERKAFAGFDPWAFLGLSPANFVSQVGDEKGKGGLE